MTKRKFKFRYRKAQNGIQTVSPDFSDVNSFLAQEASNNKTETVKAVGTTVGNAIVPGAGSIIGAAAGIGEGIAGDQTKTGANIAGDLINPFSSINALAEGKPLEAIPVVGSILQSKRIKKEKSELEKIAKREAALNTSIGRIGSDVTQNQSIAKKGKRYKKGSKFVKKFPDGTAGINPPDITKKDLDNLTSTLQNRFNLNEQQLSKLKEFVPRIGKLEDTGEATLDNPNLGFFDNIDDKIKALGEAGLEKIGNTFLPTPPGISGGQILNDTVSQSITDVINFFGGDSEANLGRFNISKSSIPEGFEDFSQEDQVLAILAENFSKASTEFDEEGSFRVAASSFNKGFENARQDELNNELSFFGEQTLGTLPKNKKGKKFQKGTKNIKPPTEEFLKIQNDSSKFAEFFTPEFSSLTSGRGVKNLGKITKKDIEEVDKFIKGELETVSNPLALSSLESISSIRKAFKENPNLNEVSLGEINFAEIPDKIIDGKEFSESGKGSTGIIPFNFKQSIEKIKSKGIDNIKLPETNLKKVKQSNTEKKEFNLPDFKFKGLKSKGSNQAKKSSRKSRKRKFQEGTKNINTEQMDIPVEVEKDEMLFRKVNGRYMLIKDFKGGATHEEGGIDTVVKEGDVIFPGSKRKQIVKFLDSNGMVSKIFEPSFEAERLKLPTDTDNNNQAREGVDLAAIGSTASQLIPAISNLVEGGKGGEKVTRRFVRPKKTRFIDNSQTRLNDLDNQFAIDRENIVRSSGGSSGSVLSNTGAASSRRTIGRSQVFAQTAAGKQQTENINTDIENKAQLTNTQLQTQFDLIDDQNEAQARNITRAGLSQLSDIGQESARQSNLKSRDEKLARTEQVKLGILGETTSDFSLSNDILNFINTGEGDINELIKFKNNKKQTVNNQPTNNPLDINPLEVNEINDFLFSNNIG